MNRDKRAANYLLVIFSGVSLILLSLPIGGKVRGLKGMLAYLIDPVPFYGGAAVERLSDMPADMVHLISVDIQNRGLREELKDIESLRTEAEALRRENARLAAELGMKPQGGRVRRWARVLERDPANWYSSIMIDAGKSDGIEVNSPVLGLQGSRLGIVGRVTEVGERTSKVLLLTDPLSAVAAYIPSKSWEGLVQGQGANKLHMNYLSVEASFTVGDGVYTSPTSASFPPDVLIGSISRINSRDPFLAFQSVEITPAVSASTLKEVMILAPKEKGQS